MDQKKQERNVEMKEMIDRETGEIRKAFVINNPEKIQSIKIRSKEQFKKAVEYRKREQYRMRGERKEQFAQAMNKYETEIVGNYPAKQMECLMRLLPHIHYNGDKELNQFDIIKVNGKGATLTNIAASWGVKRDTARKYMDGFIKDGILEKIKIEGVNGNSYRFTNLFFLKGRNKGDKFTKKVVLKQLNEVIAACDNEVEKALKKEGRKKSPRFTHLYPLALLGGLLTKVHYKTFFFLHNHEDHRLVRDDERVVDAMKIPYRYRQFKFVKQLEMWNMYRGRKVEAKEFSGREKAELNTCIQILLNVGALGQWETKRKKTLIMNPSLVYVSPNIKFDAGWKEVLETLFDLKFQETYESDESIDPFENE